MTEGLPIRILRSKSQRIRSYLPEINATRRHLEYEGSLERVRRCVCIWRKEPDRESGTKHPDTMQRVWRASVVKQPAVNVIGAI